MTERCECGSTEWAVVQFPYRGEVARVACAECGADAPGDVAAVLSALHVLETASQSAHAHAAGAAPALTPTEIRARNPDVTFGPLPLVDFERRDDRRDRRRPWTWGEVAIALLIVSYFLGFWIAVVAIAAEALS